MSETSKSERGDILRTLGHHSAFSGGGGHCGTIMCISGCCRCDDVFAPYHSVLAGNDLFCLSLAHF